MNRRTRPLSERRGRRGVIFDVDGTLVDSNDAHARAWVDAFREHGYVVPLRRVRELVGMGGDHLIPAAIGVDSESPAGEAIAERRDAIFMACYLSTVRPFPKVRELLERMLEDQLQLLVATSSQADELHAVLRIAGVDDLIHDAAPRDPSQHSKPDPDVVHAAVVRSGTPASHLVMIGDTPYDIEAAGKVGVRCVAFRCGGWPDDRLRRAEQIYDGPWSLFERYEDFERAFF